jgi:hypothetical protein
MRLAVLALFAPVVAQAAPASYLHQGRLVGPDGAPVHGAHTLTFRLYDAGTSTVRWVDAYPVTLADGHYAVTLSGTGDNGVALDTVFASPTGSLEVGITVDDGAELAPRQPLMHVPFASVSGRTDGVLTSTATFGGACTASGQLTWNAATSTLLVCNGSKWGRVTVVAPGLGSDPSNPGRSCKAILDAGASIGDGLYHIDPIGPIGDTVVQTYCDMTTNNGGWTLVSYGYRATAGGSTVYYLPNAAQGSWAPAIRDGIAAINASELVQSSTHAIVSTSNGQYESGNLAGYQKVYRYTIPTPSTTVFNLNDTSTCASTSVTELLSGTTWSAFVQSNKLSVSCSGNKAGTLYERTFLGFNRQGCYGVCGWDDAQSDGMVVWYGSGYDITTSGGAADPERAGSFAFWLR